MIYVGEWFVWDENLKPLLEKRIADFRWTTPYSVQEVRGDLESVKEQYNTLDEFVSAHFGDLL